jgi:hypothetical protein
MERWEAGVAKWEAKTVEGPADQVAVYISGGSSSSSSSSSSGTQ